MKLTVDIGNTNTKLTFFERQEIRKVSILPALNKTDMEVLLSSNGIIEAAIIASVINHSEEIEEVLKKHTDFIITLNRSTPLPISNRYQSPETLGNDRLAAVTGAYSLLPGENVLVIDAGTCIKYDIINASGEYLGGSISPGINMRYKALHNFTDKLPLLDLDQNFSLLTGTNTNESITSGVQNGIIAEAEGIIKAYETQYPGLKIILTGGDLNFFESVLKNSIFADPNLIARGLHVILNHNAR